MASDLAFERYICEINVYRCSSDEFYEQQRKELDSTMAEVKRKGGPISETQKKIFRHHLWKKYGTWRYSQVIGVIRLYVLGTSIRGETWFVDAKRITKKMSKKNFIDYGKTFELPDLNDYSSSEIYAEISEALEQVQHEIPFKNRYIDIEAFYNVGPFINWAKLLGLENNL